MALCTVVLEAPSNQRHRWTSHRAAVILQSWFGIFSNWSGKQQRIFGSTSPNGEVGHAEARTVPSIVGSNRLRVMSAIGSAPRRRETPVEEDSTRIIVDRSGS